LSAHLSPRRRLELTWRAAAEPGGEGPPLLVAHGAIAVDVERGTLRTNSAWSVRCDRGVARSLALRLDPTEELVALDLDAQPVAIEDSGPAGSTRRTIPLVTPLRPGETRRLSIATRRSIPASGTTRLTLRGLPLEHAIAQSGVLAIARSDDLWVSGNAGRGLRQIDPRTELPPDLRARPATVLAYQFVEQPFELDLTIDPSKPWKRVASQTTLTVDPAFVHEDCWLDYQVSRGRIFEVQVGLPPGLELESVGPETVVAASQGLDEPGADRSRAERILTLVLTPKARDDRSFRIHLTGRQAIDPTGRLRAALFQPLDATFHGGRIALLAARNVAVDLPGDPTEPPLGAALAPAGLAPPEDWPWPAEWSPASTPLAFWLRHEHRLTALPLRVRRLPTTLQHETTLSVQIDRRRLEVRQDVVCQVRYGALNRLEIAVPSGLEGRWELEGDEAIIRSPLGGGDAGEQRYRLVLAREAVDAVRLRFRMRLPLVPPLAPDQPRRLEVPQVRILEGSATATRVQVKADPGIRISAEEGRGWSRSHEEGAWMPDGSAPQVALIAPGDEAGPAVVIATASTSAALPSLLATQLWLRSVQGPEGTVRTMAGYRLEEHGPSLSVALPPGAGWVRARVGGQTLHEVDRLPEPSSYRLLIPADTPPGPVVVTLEYTLPATASARGWEAPRLLDGEVQQTFWELRLPWQKALVGVPEGWVDENTWSWEGLFWGRHPRPDLQLPLSGAAGASMVPPGERAGGSYHAYLFSKPEAPTALRPWIVPRAYLIGICSGLVLGLGWTLMIWRPRGRLALALALAASLIAAVAVETNVTLLVIQSSLVGVALTALAAVLQRLLDRRRMPRPALGESSGLMIPAPGSSQRIEMEVGSEESTIIRRHVGTTVERAPAPSAEGAGDGRQGDVPWGPGEG
ncbi:MAG: hypothetical protein IRY99_02685, partial [Isosphaeraceae bacterium]|nr:hypothetical protein [Isosphaeraceae bacterium]